MQRLDVDFDNGEEVSNLMGTIPTTKKLGGDFKFIIELVDFLKGWKDGDRCFFEEFHNIGWFQLQEDPIKFWAKVNVYFCSIFFKST
jgi:hypothetical protein